MKNVLMSLIIGFVNNPTRSNGLFLKKLCPNIELTFNEEMDLTRVKNNIG